MSINDQLGRLRKEGGHSHKEAARKKTIEFVINFPPNSEL